jgi:hypothetical protein
MSEEATQRRIKLLTSSPMQSGDPYIKNSVADALADAESEGNQLFPRHFHVGVAACLPAADRHYGDASSTSQTAHAVWFSFFLTSFFENLAVGRIWLCRESKYH